MRTNRRSTFLKAKLKTLSGLTRTVRALKRRGKTIVFTNGCFDLLHYGHVRYLEQAKAKGDILVVGVNSDGSVRKIKGKGRPIVGEQERSRVIAALESVDYVVIFKEEIPLRVIKALRPDILVKGADWKSSGIVGSGIVKSYGGRILRLRLVKGLSTTALVRKIAKIPKK
ncbi:D-glycero-beta-D-manno-heptose 1-phosphate adenylyltransferase [Candidatus Omnitrophota bacterium]